MYVVSKLGVAAADNSQRIRWAETVELPFSEVCMAMRVAGQRRPVIALEGNMAQILNGDGSCFSAPVTRGEAGLSYDDHTRIPRVSTGN